jgi:hypothetical protein
MIGDWGGSEGRCRGGVGSDEDGRELHRGVGVWVKRKMKACVQDFFNTYVWPSPLCGETEADC